ncbi:hypothetical protein H9N25_04655 [Pedobacter riviphilus]|uniref:Uncharacterized protein n=1 Tax=Pedobacter riviphilus TaxID=2766984 RepID=A0ABX6TJT5_9SPHI|nr:hypothetical protein [Pedobacter riviphilus]QNR85756.1 hypothetical protein H9N25_04655 [Pedobacter riviphilus]
MLRKFISQNTFWCALIIVAGLTASCKKSNNNNPDANIGGESNLLQTPTNDRALLTKDSIFLYAKQTYFWNAGMPNYDTFNRDNTTLTMPSLQHLRLYPAPEGKINILLLMMGL